MFLPSNETCVCTLPPAGGTRLELLRLPAINHQRSKCGFKSRCSLLFPWVCVKSFILAARLTEHHDPSLGRQSASRRLAFAAVHQAVVHLHAVDAEGAVGEQRETGVLVGGKKINSCKREIKHI